MDEAVQEAKDANQEANEAREQAEAVDAQEAADKAKEAAEKAQEIADEIGNESAQEKAQDAQDAADEAQEAADAAQELEEMIREMFEEEGLPEEEYEDFKQGVLDELFGEEDEMEDEYLPQEETAPDETGYEVQKGVQLKQKYGRKYVNWETGETAYYGESDPITNEWIEVTPFFSGIYQNGREVVVERTLDGAIQLLSALGISVSNRTKTEFKIVNPTDQARNLLREMRMFVVSNDSVSY